MRNASHIGVLVAALAMGIILVGAAMAETATRDIEITLKADGERCVVRDVTLHCSDLAAYLRDTLKLPRGTTIHLQAARAASYQSVRTVLDIIEKSGFNHPVGYLTESKSSEGK